MAAARTGTWYWHIGTDSHTRDANLNELLGLQRKTTTQPLDDFIDRIHPDDRKKVREAIEPALENRADYETDFRIRHPDGTVRWLRDRGRVFYDTEGAPEVMAGACVDITGQKQAEAQQHAYLDRISLLIYASYEVIKKDTIPDVLQGLADEARALTGTGIAAAGYGYENEDFQLTAMSPEGCPVQNINGFFPESGRGIYRDIIRYSKPVRLSEAELQAHPSWQDALKCRPRIKDLLGVPLLEHRGLACGLVLVSDKKHGGFTPEDEMLLSQFALFASLAIQHIEARLELQHMHNHLEKRVQQRTEALMSANLALEREITGHKRSESRLRESEERFRSVIESMAEGMLLLDEEGVIVDCNKNAETILGQGQKSLIGTAFTSFEHLFIQEDKEAPFSPAALSIMITQRSAQPVHNVILGLNNPLRGTVWISLNAQPVYSRTGEHPQGTVVTLNDITSRKQLEDDLRRKTEQYRAVVEDQTELICRFHTSGEITFVNDAYCRYFGKRHRDLIGTRFLPFISKKDKQSLWPRIASLSGDNRSCLIEQRLKLPNGSTRWTQWSITALVDHTGSVYEYQGVGRDIHEIKELQETVKQNQYLLQSVVNGISDPLYMVDRNYLVQMANQATLDYYGVHPEGVIGQPCYRVFMDEQKPCADCSIFRQTTRHQPKTFERAGRLAPHTYEQVTIYPLKRQKAAFMSAIIHIKDITKTKMLEKRIGQSERLASLGLLISGITHEINNPNNFITFNIPVLRDYISTLLPIVDNYADGRKNFTVFNMPYDEFRQDLHRLVDNMEHGSERITRTVSSLREFIRNEGSGAISQVSIKDVIDKAVTLCGTKIKKAVRSFSVDVDDDMGIIHTDPHALEHVIIILLVNAAEAADKKDSSIRIAARPGTTWQEKAVIEVTDNGCGIAQEHLDKVFDPFFTTKTESGGTGLGMYICSDIIKGIGGTVTLESVPGEGTTVRIVIPDIHEE